MKISIFLLLMVGMADHGSCWTLGVDPQRDCSKAETVFTATYDPNGKPSLKLREYLKGKGSSEAELALMEASAQVELKTQCEVIVFAWFTKNDEGLYAAGKRPLVLYADKSDSGDNIYLYLVKNNQMILPHGGSISLERLKRLINQQNPLTNHWSER